MLVPHIKSSPSNGSRRIFVLGSTGSIGKSTLEVIAAAEDRFKLIGISAHKNSKELYQQILKYRPQYAVLTDAEAFKELKILLSGHPEVGTEVLTGNENLAALAADGSSDTVVAGIVGFAGLKSVIAALEQGKRVALANKESLVCAGMLVKNLIQKTGAELIPVDSEHSAIFQVMQGQDLKQMDCLILTASGGPFLHTPLAELSKITPAQAVKHPRWNMGPKISIDSATMVNKALELIEAHWLFDFSPDSIQVLIHPQSIIHSLIRFTDGTQLAQLSQPDMKGAIAFALSYPGARIAGVVPQLDLAQNRNLEFSPFSNERFPAVNLARQAVKTGGAAAAVFNFANEHAVAEFIQRKLKFTEIVLKVESALDKFAAMPYTCFNDLMQIKVEVEAFLDS